MVLWTEATWSRSQTGSSRVVSIGLMKYGKFISGTRTGEGVLEADLAVAECSIDHRRQALIEIHGGVEERLVVLCIEVLIRARGGSGAIGSTLQPAIVFTPSSSGHNLDWDQLEAIEGSPYRRTISEGA